MGRARPSDQVVRCDCGYVVVGVDEDGLVEAVRTHATVAHGIVFTAEEALLVVFRSQLERTREPVTTDARVSRMASDEGGET
jgi:predicted small metal-binding protein